MAGDGHDHLIRYSLAADPAGSVDSSSMIRPSTPSPYGITEAPSITKPSGMTDQEYHRVLVVVRARQMTESERQDFAKNLQKYWRDILTRVRNTAQRLVALFDRTLNRNSTDTLQQDAAPDDMFTKRIYRDPKPRTFQAVTKPIDVRVTPSTNLPFHWQVRHSTGLKPALTPEVNVPRKLPTSPSNMVTVKPEKQDDNNVTKHHHYHHLVVRE